MSRKIDYTTIEFTHNSYWYCQHGVYDRYSVLAGQDFRQLVSAYATLADAVAAHPEAEVLEHEYKPAKSRPIRSGLCSKVRGGCHVSGHFVSLPVVLLILPRPSKLGFLSALPLLLLFVAEKRQQFVLCHCFGFGFRFGFGYPRLGFGYINPKSN